MATTLLPKKSGETIPVAVDDDHYQQMADDPSISAIPQGSTWGNNYNQPAYNQQATSNFGNTQNINQSTSGTPVRTGAAPTNAASGAEIEVENTNTDWVNKKWRPAMGWMYMVVCITDFVLFPILWAVIHAVVLGKVGDQWEPLTLQGAGLFHIAMGAVLGIAAYGRTKEKIESKA